MTSHYNPSSKMTKAQQRNFNGAMHLIGKPKIPITLSKKEKEDLEYLYVVYDIIPPIKIKHNSTISYNNIHSGKIVFEKLISIPDITLTLNLDISNYNINNILKVQSQIEKQLNITFSPMVGENKLIHPMNKKTIYPGVYKIQISGYSFSGKENVFYQLNYDIV